MSELLNRKQFLANSAKFSLAAAIGIGGISALTSKSVEASPPSPQSYNWPWTYAYVDPDEVRIKAHDLFWADKDCASGVFGSFLEVLKEKVGEPWSLMPMEVMLFGRGGGVSTWGATCGTLVGGAGIISLVVPKADSTALVNELWGWYSTEMLPTDKANSADYTDKRYTDNIVPSLSGSVLCHASLTQWCMLAQVDKGSDDRKERCGRLAGDIAAKTAEILNDYFATKFEATFVVPASNATCNNCHGDKVLTTMECVSCHGSDTYPHVTSVANKGDINEFKIEQNFPNPFISQTNLTYTLPKDAKIKLEVFDIRGQLVRSLIDPQVSSSGTYNIQWDGRNNLGESVVGGVYFAKLTSENYMKTIMMNRLK